MLERYFVKPATVDRIRTSWIGSEIEQYVEWLTERGYAVRCVHQRVPLLVAFGEFAWAGGARTVQELPGYIDGFVRERMMGRPATRPDGGRRNATRLRGPVEQMLTVVIPGFVAAGREPYPNPFRDALPGFFAYLQDERGLRPLTIGGYRHHLRRFEQYLSRIGVARLSELSPSILSAFVADRASDGWEVASLADLRCCGCSCGSRIANARLDGISARRLSGRRAIGWQASRGRSPGRRSAGCWPRWIAARRMASVTGCPSARPGTRRRSRRGRSETRWWTISSTVVPSLSSGSCSCARSRLCAR